MIALCHVELYSDPPLTRILGSINREEARKKSLNLVAGTTAHRTHPLPFSDELTELISETAETSGRIGRRITPRGMFLTLMQGKMPSSERGQARQALKRMLSESQLSEQLAAFIEHYSPDRNTKPSVSNAHSRGVKAADISSLTVNLVEEARQGKLPRVSGRQAETEELLYTLMRSRKNTPVLVGEAGVGKTAIVEGLAARIASGDVPDYFVGKSILSLDLGQLVSGTRYRGDFEERMTQLIEQLRAGEGNIILFIDELHAIIGAGASSDSKLDAATMLKPVLARGAVQLIGATTTHEYELLTADSAFERRLHPIWVKEPDAKSAILMVGKAAKDLAAHHQLTIDADVAALSVLLSERHLPNRRLPDKAIDLLDAASALAAMGGGSQVTSDDICRVLEGWCGRNISAADEGTRLAGLRERINGRVLGQQQSINEICGQLERSMLGLTEARGPLASFLLAGPPGVGKTETARALADELMGDADSLVRFDMSEFTERHDLSKLLGAAPGYVGFEQGSPLTEQLRHNPHRVILFDEIEKAHPDVLGVLLQALEEGEITDSRGNKADLRHCVVLLTSNLGSGNKSQPAGFAGQADRGGPVQAAVEGYLRPELLDRLDGVCVYQPLGDKALDSLSARALAPLRTQLKSRGIKLTLRPAARKMLRESCRQQNGARALRRRVELEVAGPIAALLLAGAEYPQAVVLDADNTKIYVICE
jgi:ATP-dependent Clp protease ATP-binding subunit ClpC